jgi:hypothetical protein
VSGQLHDPAALSPGKEPPVPIGDSRLGGPQNRSGRREEKILDPTDTRTPTPWSSSPHPVATPTALQIFLFLVTFIVPRDKELWPVKLMRIALNYVKTCIHYTSWERALSLQGLQCLGLSRSHAPVVWFVLLITIVNSCILSLPDSCLAQSAKLHMDLEALLIRVHKNQHSIKYETEEFTTYHVRVLLNSNTPL